LRDFDPTGLLGTFAFLMRRFAWEHEELLREQRQAGGIGHA
jgi:hypothetical protein